MKRCNPESSRLEQIIGLGERSVRKNYYPQLRENVEQVKRFRALLDDTSDWVILFSLTPFQIDDANTAMCRFFSVTLPEIRHGRVHDYLLAYPDSPLKGFLSQIKSLTKEDLSEGITREFAIQQEDGTLWLDISCKQAAFEGQQFVTVVARDISERIQHRQTLQSLLNEKEALIDNALVGLAWVQQRIIVSCNRKLETMVGCQPGELNGQSSRVLYDSQQTFLDFGEDAYRMLGEGMPFTGEIKLSRKDGTFLWAQLTGNAIDPNDPNDGSVWIFQDVHEHMITQEKADFLAFHDPLTELPNHKKLQEYVAQWLENKPQQGLSLFSIDLDKFKNINDLLGYHESNKLLIEISNRLKYCLNAQGLVSRQGGDEFTIVVPNMDSPDACLPLLKQVRRELTKPFYLAGKEFSLTCSVGVAVYPQDGQTFDQLLSRSTMAMYEAKQSGRNTYRYFNASMNDVSKETMAIALSLKKALELGQFELHYQPQVSLQSGQLIGAEALIRWHHPELGMVPPSKFIPVAEDTGMIVAIGDWVLQQACLQVKKWAQMGMEKPVIAVNLSAIQFNSGDIEDTVRKALDYAGIEAHMIELELTESIIMKDADNVLQKVKNLKQMGCQLSIDDFGTGYSSLAYLKRFTVDKLKIDQNFVKDMSRNADDEAIVRTIIQMAQNLGLTTIAEGIEDRETMALLTQYRCDEAQGYFIARPMNEDAFNANLEDYRAFELTR